MPGRSSDGCGQGIDGMARYKDVDGGMKLLAVDLGRQLLPGTFEHALAHLIDQELDLSHFDAHYRNDERGSAAYPPAMLLKVVLFAYSQGILSSRAIERACRDHVTFMALSGDSAPHFTTIAAFVSGREKDIAQVFAAVLSICLNQGLIGREMFAIDGVKLPSNAAKACSGTRADFQKQLDKLEAAASVMRSAIASRTTGRQKRICRPTRRSASRACSAKRRGCASGCRVMLIAGARAARSARVTAPTTSRPRWLPRRAYCRATPASPTWMHDTSSLSRRRRMAPAPIRSCCSVSWRA